MTRRAPIAALVLALALTGAAPCAQAQARAPGTPAVRGAVVLPAPGAQVRLVLRRPELAPAQLVLGEPVNLNVEGRLVAIDSSAVTVRTLQGATYTYPADGVRRLSVRRCRASVVADSAGAAAPCADGGHRGRVVVAGLIGALVGGGVLINRAPLAGAAGGAVLGAVVGSLGGGGRYDLVPWPVRP